jgi:hypothetical protein
MDMFNRDLFAKGSEQAFKDVEAGKPKDARGVVRHFKAWFWGDDGIDSYIKGYNEGYEKAILKEHNVFYPPAEPPSGAGSTIHDQGGQSMSQGTSYDEQISLLEHLQAYLLNFQDGLATVSANYANKVNALGDSGMMRETYKAFSGQQLAETRQLIQNLVQHIDQDDIPAVKKEIQNCQEALSSL